MYDARWGDDPRDADPREEEHRPERRRSRDDGAEPAHSPRGGSPRTATGTMTSHATRAAHAGVAMTTRGRSGVVAATTGRALTSLHGTPETMPGGPNGTVKRWGVRVTRSDVFTRHVDLPRGPERERVQDRDRVYTLRGSESRTLATVGAFRVVSSGDLRDHDGSRANLRSGDLRHLRDQGLIRDGPRAWLP